jgi:cold shock CspA family protein/ribosome-associated translation inhibitor RaiA
MTMPVEVSFKGMEPSPALETRIRERAARLERFADRILRCHVTVEAPHRHHRQGNLFAVRIMIDVPGGQVAVTHDNPQDHAHEDAHVAVRDAFAAAVRRLEDHVRRLDGDVKRHEPAMVPGRVLRFVAGDDYGFIATHDGRDVYFHRNSVAQDGFDRLRVGDRVHLTLAEGDKGLQAVTVHPVGAGPARV